MLQQIPTRRFRDGRLLLFGSCRVRKGTKLESMGRSYLMCHFWNQFVKVGHFLIDVDNVSPFFSAIPS